MLASFAPALPLGPLLTHALRCTHGAGNASSLLRRDFFAFWASNAYALNGNAWIPLPPSLQLVVSTSESGVGAHVHGTLWRMAHPFTAAELQRMQQLPEEQSLQERWSRTLCTLRELAGYLCALRELLRTAPDLLPVGAIVQVWGGDEDAWAAAWTMRGSEHVLAAVADLRLAAWDTGLELQFVRAPHALDTLCVARTLAHQQDATDWRLSRRAMLAQVYTPLDWYPQVDLFASAHARQVPAPAQRRRTGKKRRNSAGMQEAGGSYYAREWDGKCVGVDALSHAWPPRREGSSDAVHYFAFPPPQLLLRTLQKIAADGPEVLLRANADAGGGAGTWQAATLLDCAPAWGFERVGRAHGSRAAMRC